MQRQSETWGKTEGWGLLDHWAEGEHSRGWRRGSPGGQGGAHPYEGPLSPWKDPRTASPALLPDGSRMFNECFIHSELALLGRMSSFLQEEIKRQAFLRHLHGDLFLFHTE